MTNSWSKMTNSWSKRNMAKAIKIESFPDDVLFEILLRVPAQDLYESSRLVCRKWYNTINTRNFAHSHLQRLTPGLLTVNMNYTEQAFMTMRNGQIEMSKWSYGNCHLVMSSCDGLVLEVDSNSKPYITNHVTKQHLTLPHFLSNKVRVYKWFALAYVASSSVYKVVGVYYPVERDHDLVCAIMTIGVDTDWRRRVSAQHLSDKAKTLLRLSPLTTTRGFLHWAEDECVVTMNVDSEIITEIPGPPYLRRDDGKKSLWCRYLPMGSYLSLFIGRGDFSWEVWKMKPETGEWTKMPSIDLEPQKVPKYLFLEFEKYPALKKHMLVPIGWSNFHEVLFFRVCLHTIGYNVRTREIDSCKLLDTLRNLYLEHTRSLVWLDY